MLKHQIKLCTSSQISYECTIFIVWQLKEMQTRINFKYFCYQNSTMHDVKCFQLGAYYLCCNIVALVEQQKSRFKKAKDSSISARQKIPTVLQVCIRYQKWRYDLSYLI